MKDQLYEISGKFLGGRKEKEHSYAPERTDGHLERYKKLMDTGEYMQMAFEKAGADGTLSKVDKDIIICMASDAITGDPYDLRYKSQKLADVYYVKVVRVDDESRTVWVSHNEARKDKRPEIEEEINNRLKKDNGNANLRVKGKVIRIQSKTVDGENIDTGVWLDLCGVGILGFVYIGDWANTFTSALKGTVSYGDVVEVCIHEKKIRKQKKQDIIYYACSRKELVEDPWAGE